MFLGNCPLGTSLMMSWKQPLTGQSRETAYFVLSRFYHFYFLLLGRERLLYFSDY
jgi:hypothetical protein